MIASTTSWILVGCARDHEASDGGAIMFGDGGGATEASSTTSDDPSPDTTASVPVTSSSDGGSDGQEPSGIVGCSIWEQDCPEGEKCTPWANSNDDLLNDTRCVPVDAGAGQPGDDCVAVDWGAGLDTCGLGSLCWFFDLETLQGTCVAMCRESEEQPSCEHQPETTCIITNPNHVVALCLGACDPLSQGCPEGTGCYWTYEEFLCLPDSSGPVGGHGSPCDALGGVTSCDPGFLCATVPGCTDSSGCCTRLCDLDQPQHVACPEGAADGQICAPLYNVPSEYENVGFCTLP